jgi:hypothetical protein
MEYLQFDYLSVNKDLNFINYYLFALDGKKYKFYLFDLFLSRYNYEIPELKRNEINYLVLKQKTLIFFPYICVATIIGINIFKKKFYEKNYYIEFKLVSKLFLFVSFFRLIQKSILKYESDEILKYLYENKI